MIDSSGVGFAIVKKLVELYGGRVTLESAPGQGADFSFDWPTAIDQDSSGPDVTATIA